MGAIGRWIDEKCAAEPDVMRRVLNRKFGNLERFISGEKCGCLVGSYGLERGDEWASRGSCPLGQHGLTVIGFRVAGLLTWRGDRRNDIINGNTFRYKRPQQFVVRLLKQRIRKALGLAPVRVTERGLGVPTPQEQPQ